MVIGRRVKKKHNGRYMKEPFIHTIHYIVEGDPDIILKKIGKSYTKVCYNSSKEKLNIFPMKMHTRFSP